MEPFRLLIPPFVADAPDVLKAIAATSNVSIANVYVARGVRCPLIPLEQWLAGKR